MRILFYVNSATAGVCLAMATLCFTYVSAAAGASWLTAAAIWALAALIVRQGCDFEPPFDRAQRRYEDYQASAPERHREALAADAAARREV